MTPGRLSVVIPALDEERCLAQLLADLDRQTGVALEVLVVDGGSTDGTRTVAREAGVTVVPADRGRARALNAGARAASGERLLFLHADSRLPDERQLARAVGALASACAEAGHDRIAGHFPLQFITRDGRRGLGLRYTESKTHHNRLNTTNGDQGFLLQRTFFEALGGFDETFHFLEDQALAARIRATGRWITLPGVLRTSARRFEVEGYGRLLLLMMLIESFWSVGQHAFFRGASDLYRAQGDTARRRLTPFMGLMWRVGILDHSWPERLRVIGAFGRHFKGHSWQLAQFADVLTGSRGGFLRLHDRWVWPLIRHRAFDLPASVLVFAVYAMLLTPAVWLSETIGSARPSRRR